MYLYSKRHQMLFGTLFVWTLSGGAAVRAQQSPAAIPANSYERQFSDNWTCNRGFVKKNGGLRGRHPSAQLISGFHRLRLEM